MPARIVVADGIIVHPGVAVPGLDTLGGFGDYCVRGGEASEQGVVKPCPVVIQTLHTAQGAFVQLPGILPLGRHTAIAEAPFTPGFVPILRGAHPAAVCDDARAPQMIAQDPGQPGRAGSTPHAHAEADTSRIIILHHRAGGAGPFEVITDIDRGRGRAGRDGALDPLSIPIIQEGGAQARPGHPGQVVLRIVAQIVGRAHIALGHVSIGVVLERPAVAGRSHGMLVGGVIGVRPKVGFGPQAAFRVVGIIFSQCGAHGQQAIQGIIGEILDVVRVWGGVGDLAHVPHPIVQVAQILQRAADHRLQAASLPHLDPIQHGGLIPGIIAIIRKQSK